MGIKAKYTATCDGCGLIVERELTPESDMEGINDMELFSPALPEGWWQTEDDDGDDVLRVYHSRECLEQWLINQGRASEAEELRTAPTFA